MSLEEYRSEKSVLADHLWKEKQNCLHLLLDEVKIFESEEHWRIRCLKESADFRLVACWVDQV